MNLKRTLILPIAVAATCCAFGAAAGGESETKTERKHVIALKTGDFELAETDVSDLAVGESETIVTDSGKTIDLLRTVDGLEVYVDGQMIDMNFSEANGLHGDHEGLHRKIEIVCTDEEECDDVVWVSEGEDIHVELHADGEANHLITKEVIIECTGEEDCAEHNVWVSADGDVTSLEDVDGEVHVIRLHEDIEGEHEGGEKVIRIHKKSDHH